MALQEAAEAYLVSLFEDTNLAAIHAKRECFFVLYVSTAIHDIILQVSLCKPPVSTYILYLATDIVPAANPKILPSLDVSVANALKLFSGMPSRSALLYQKE